MRSLVAGSAILLAFAQIVVGLDAHTLVEGIKPFGDAGSVPRVSITDNEKIVNTLSMVDQKSGPAPTDPPNLPINDTSVTAVDGELVNQSVNVTQRSTDMNFPRHFFNSRITRRDFAANLFLNVFHHKPATEPDASVEGTAYLTFKLVSNDTYNVHDCLKACWETKNCVFANLFYEFNNPSLNQEASNLKCSLFAQVHKAVEKTNHGGQVLISDAKAPATSIMMSSGWALKDVADPDVPTGFDSVFGPITAANHADGYMGFVLLDRYDPSACAEACNNRTADAEGGVCRAFNIWTAVTNDIPTSYTCSMYYLPLNETSATNTGQGDLNVAESRGYNRQSADFDGGFEKDNACSDFCYVESTSYWTGSSLADGHWDALIFYTQTYAHRGNGVATLGSGDGQDSLPGTFTSAPITTVSGATHCLQFYHASTFNGALETTAFLEVYWNNALVTRIDPGYSEWSVYMVTVLATGSDVIKLVGGYFPAYDFVDDISLYRNACPSS